MTYFNFLLLALVPPIILLGGIVFRVRVRLNISSASRAVCFVVVLALLYTTPWDNYLIYRGVWGYGAERVMGVIGFVPVEEYMFMALQAVMTGMLALLIFRRVDLRREVGSAGRAGGMAVWLGVTAAGVWMLVSGLDRWLYLGLILAWAGPVLAGTWWLGSQRFVASGWAYAGACLIPSVYLWMWDAYAIADGIWAISERYTVGVGLGSLPVEEAVFFLLTNVLVVQGVLLFWEGPSS